MNINHHRLNLVKQIRESRIMDKPGTEKQLMLALVEDIKKTNPSIRDPSHHAEAIVDVFLL